MEETVIGTFDDVKFIEGVTKMNQTNWQNYFRHGFKNGVYDGLNVEIPDVTETADGKIYDGTAFANGLCVSINTSDGYTTFPKNSPTDRLFCLRVYFKEQTAKLIMKTGISSDSTCASVIGEASKFFLDESYFCERNDTIYDIPLRYAGAENRGYDFLRFGFDLRRLIQPPRETITDSSRAVQISKNNICNVVANAHGADAVGTLCCPDLVNITDGAIISVTGGEYPKNTIAFGCMPYYGNGYWGETNYSEYHDWNSPITIKYKTKGTGWVNFQGRDFPRLEWRFPNNISTLIVKLTYLGYEPYSSSQSDFGRGTYTFFIEELES